MGNILGLDLGTNSIGWAIIEDQKNKIIDIGVRIFPEGVNNLGEGENEISKNATRTDARGTRRQIFRRSLRKKILLKILIENNMCPINIAVLNKWKKTKQFPELQLKNWFNENPYELRHKALHQEITLEQLGRIFYHFIQRRGFQSNSRSAGKDDGAIYKGNNKEGKTGIIETNDAIGNNTLGSYLNNVVPKKFAQYKNKNERARNRYTTRQMYIDEFEAIWNKQQSFHPELTPNLKEKLGGRKKDGYAQDGVLFFQRPLRSQKHLVGNCTLEPKKTKCPISAIPFELFRSYQFVNTIEFNGTKLNEYDRNAALNVLLKKEKPSFKEIKKAINKLDNVFKFNYKDDDKVLGTYTISNLSNKKFFGKQWFEFTEKEQEDIWHILYFFEDKDKLKTYAIDKWGFDEMKADKISKFHLKDKYSSLSRKAINNILPFLKIGFNYDEAVVFGGIKNAFGAKWNLLTKPQLNFLYDNIPSIIHYGSKGGFLEPLKKMLKSEFELKDEELQKLYHHSASITNPLKLDFLPVDKNADKEIQNIRNPIVSSALFELRKLVNEIIKTHGKLDEIKIELARDLKISKTQRNNIRREQKRLEKVNDDAKKRLAEDNIISTHENVLKYKLWEECQHTCPYTGKSISKTQLYSGEVQIEHIIPWSRSLNDSYLNKTLCFADENRAKGDRTPYEFYSKQSKEKWEEVKDRTIKIFHDTKEFPNRYKKFKLFTSTSFDSDFISRQLNDTRYISREAKNFLKKICNNITVAPGQMTSNLRHKWGLNNILNKVNNEKSRDDHRHHAVDALIMACSKIKYLQELSKWNRYHRTYDLNIFPLPWEGFREEAEKKISEILVSHKQTNKIVTTRYHKTLKDGKTFINKGVAARGQLHKETIFGKRKPQHLEEAFHIRKPLETLTTKKHIEKIVDLKIKENIYKRIESLGGFTGKKNDQIPNESFFISDNNGKKQPQIFLPNKNGDPVPVKKVRMRENISGAEKLKENINQYVNPRNNHHVLIYRDFKDNLNYEVVSFWTAVERINSSAELYFLPENGKEIIETFKINDMFILGKSNNEFVISNSKTSEFSKNLYKVQKIAGSDYFLEICFRKHTDSREDKRAKSDYLYIKGFGKGKTGWQTFNPIKVTISPGGKIKKVQ